MRAKVVRGAIHPLFSQLTDEDLKLASAIIETYSSMVGMRKGMLMEALKELESAGDYRFVRGLSVLMERRSTFVSSGSLDPVSTRALVFRLASRRYLERDEVLDQAAQALGCSRDEIERSLWSDVEENLILKGFSPVKPEELLKEYNVELAETAIMRATSMTLWISEGWKELLRDAKWLGLMYQASREGELLRLDLEGPLSLLKMTDRYGSSLAKLFHMVVSGSIWKIRAQVVSGSRNRLFELELSSEKEGRLLAGLPQEKAVAFDSEVESRFYGEFRSLGTGWEITREPEPLIVNGTVFIPDFAFQKYGRKVYMEIVGFWTPDYLKRKIQKLRGLSQDMILAVNEELGELNVDLPEVITYKRWVQPGDVYKLLYRREVQELGRIAAREFHFEPEGDAVDLKRVASENGIPMQLLKKSLEQKPLAGYHLVGDHLYSDLLMNRVASILERLEGSGLAEVQAALAGVGVADAEAALETLGYKVVWSSLDPKDAKVVGSSCGSPHGT